MSSDAVSLSPAPTSSFVNLRNGLKYHYLELRASGPSVVLLHGYVEPVQSEGQRSESAYQEKRQMPVVATAKPLRCHKSQAADGDV